MCVYVVREAQILHTVDSNREFAISLKVWNMRTETYTLRLFGLFDSLEQRVNSILSTLLTVCDVNRAGMHAPMILKRKRSGEKVKKTLRMCTSLCYI